MDYSEMTDSSLERREEPTDPVVGAVEEVLNQVVMAAIDDAELKADAEFKVRPAQMGQPESCGPLAGLDRLLKLLDSLDHLRLRCLDSRISNMKHSTPSMAVSRVAWCTRCVNRVPLRKWKVVTRR